MRWIRGASAGQHSPSTYSCVQTGLASSAAASSARAQKAALSSRSAADAAVLTAPGASVKSHLDSTHCARTVYDDLKQLAVSRAGGAVAWRPQACGAAAADHGGGAVNGVAAMAVCHQRCGVIILLVLVASKACCMPWVALVAGYCCIPGLCTSTRALPAAAA